MINFNQYKKQMKNVFTKIFCILSLSIFIIGCSEEKSDIIEEDTISNELKDGFSISIGVDMTNTYDLSKISLEEVFENTMKAFYEEDMTESFLARNGDSDTDENSSFLAVDFHITETQVIVTTSSGNDVSSATDDEKCGGDNGDGWKSYGLCVSRTCVEEKTAEAAQELSLQLQPGKCLDIRVKRNTLSARVCGRLVSC